MAYEWYTAARAEIGTTEVPGSENNPRIVDYHRETWTGQSDDSVAWCASFVNWCLKEAGIAGTGSPAARSFLQWGREIPEPVKGCIVVLKRGNQAWQGHVGFYEGEADDPMHFRLLGGNQNDSVNVSTYRKSDVLGYRMPVRVRDSTTVRTAAGGAAVISTAAGALVPVIDKVADKAWFDVVIPYVIIGVAIVGGAYLISERLKKQRERQL